MLRSILLIAAAIAGTGALAMAPAASPKLCNVRAFGVRGDGKTLDTRAIQAAIDSCAGLGGTAYLGQGTYVTGTLRLKSHMTLKLDNGAVLSATHDISQYWPSSSIGLGHTYGTDIAGEGQLTGLLVATNVTDLTIEGPGIIDGQSDAFMSPIIHNSHDYSQAAVRNPKAFEAAMNDAAYGPMEPVSSGRPGVLLLIFHGKDVALKEINLRDSPNWTLVLQDVERATVSDFSIVNNPLMPNNDGIDCMACRNVHIHDGTIRTGDDDFAVVNTEDITVSRVSMYSRSAAVRLESTQRAVFSNLTIDSNRGLAIFASRQISRPTDGVIFTSVVMQTHLIPGHWWGKGEPIYIAVQPCGGARACGGGVRNVTFSDIEAQAEAGAVLAGTPGLPLSGITLSQVRLRIASPAPAIASAIGGNFDLRWTAPTPATGIVRHDIPAIDVEHADGLALRDVEIVWVGQQPDYATEAVNASHFTDLSIQGLYEHGAAPRRRAALAFADGDRLLLEDVRVARNATPLRLLRVTNVQTSIPALR